MKKYLIIAVVAILAILALIFIYKGPKKTEQPITKEKPVTSAPGSTAPRPQPSASQGRTVFAIADVAAPLDNIKSVILTVSEVRVHSSDKGWFVVSNTPKDYDLIVLRREGSRAALLADVNLETSSYQQIRLSVSKVVVTDKAGKSEEAKLPSKELKINTLLEVRKGETSSVLLDFMLDRSLHLTGNGKYILAPVLHIETRSDVGNVQISNDIQLKGERAEFIGGRTRFTADFGMDEGGEMTKDFVLDRTATLEIIGNTIKIIPPGQRESEIKVSAEAALDTAIKGGYVDNTLSIKVVTYANKLAWRIIGTKNLEVKIVYISAISGEVLGVE